MTPLDTPRRAFDSRTFGGKLGPNKTIRIPILPRPGSAFVRLTCVGSEGAGHLSVSGTDNIGDTALVNFDPDGVESDGAPVGLPDGQLRLRAVGAAAHVIVDVYAEG